MRETTLQIEEIDIDCLVPYENNAKEHTRAQIDAVEASSAALTRSLTTKPR